MENLVGIAVEWAVFLARWLHIVAAVAWVGASFYFIWVENALIRGGEQRGQNVAGHLWLIHGGGFYYLEKQSVSPKPLPPALHWFKWEAYTTWLSGAFLLVLLYYFNAGSMLLLAGSNLSAAAGVGIGVGFLAGGWCVYAAACRTPLLRRPLWFCGLAVALAAVAAWALLQVFTPRAVFVHLGAMLATIMAGNVLMIIIPSQKRMVRAAEAGEALPAAAGVIPGLRSLHNNYLALPVVFLMISVHFPLATGAALAPAVLVCILLFAGFLRHVINLHNKGRGIHKGYLAAAALFLALAFVCALPASALRAAGDDAPPTTAAIMPLLQKHCAGCHAQTPTDKIFVAPPLGYVVETPAQAEASRKLIYQRVVLDNSMPFNNQTGMTEEERARIGAWARAQ